MRSLLLLIPLATLLAQAPVRTAPTAAAVKNYKESGSPNAPITLEVYTDFQCPMCRVFYLDVLPSVLSEYVASGKVRLVHRDFPLSQHAYTRVAVKYANAAGQLGIYDLVANQIFKTQQEWDQNGNIDGEVAKVVPPAQMQKLRDLVKNDARLDDTVTSDMALANRDRVNQTPTLIIVSHGKRNKIDGFLPLAILRSYLDQLLAKG